MWSSSKFVGAGFFKIICSRASDRSSNDRQTQVLSYRLTENLKFKTDNYSGKVAHTAISGSQQSTINKKNTPVFNV